jgi:uncharacterized membrane-anchored protein YitT (DUF2179 family)
MERFSLTYSPAWNLFLLTLGAALYAVGLNALAIQHNLIQGGLFGVALLVNYGVGGIPPGALFFLLNVPFFAVAWKHTSRRFLLYSLYCMTVTAFLVEAFRFTFEVRDELYAALAAGALCGAGAGCILRSLGSGGGLDIMAVLLNRKFNIGIGKFYFFFNFALFCFSFLTLPVDKVIGSLIMVFVTSVVMEYILVMFSQRKVCFVVSDKSREIVGRIMKDLALGSTLLRGCGAYTSKDKDIIMTVINNLQLKRLEEIVFTTDEHALFIVENTFNVIGSSFSRRKIF